MELIVLLGSFLEDWITIYPMAFHVYPGTFEDSLPIASKCISLHNAAMHIFRGVYSTKREKDKKTETQLGGASVKYLVT